MSASTAGEDNITEEGGAQADDGGLIPGHAYSIIKVKECQGNLLLNIRNPWGTFEWQGDWGDADKKHWKPDIVGEL